MFCSTCGKELLDSSKFCAHCGSQIGVVPLMVQESIPSDETLKNKSVYSSVGDALNRATNAVSSVANTVALGVGDLNGDGKIDAEDFKIAAAKAKEIGNAAMNESVKLGKEVMQSDLVKDVTPYAAIGAAVAVPIPFVGPVIGAAAGAVLGLLKNVTKK